jgi:hypothetical protein
VPSERGRNESTDSANKDLFLHDSATGAASRGPKAAAGQCDRRLLFAKYNKLFEAKVNDPPTTRSPRKRAVSALPRERSGAGSHEQAASCMR